MFKQLLNQVQNKYKEKLEENEKYGEGSGQTLVAESEKLDWNGILKYNNQAVFPITSFRHLLHSIISTIQLLQ